MDIWLEYDLLGNVSVVGKSSEDSSPFVYETFYYAKFITDNYNLKNVAFEQAKKLGFKGDFKDIKIVNKGLTDYE